MSDPVCSLTADFQGLYYPEKVRPVGLFFSGIVVYLAPKWLCKPLTARVFMHRGTGCRFMGLFLSFINPVGCLS
jgi:hypothetical protein